jgi:hypothetical protein
MCVYLKNPEHEATWINRWHGKADPKTEAISADAPANSNVPTETTQSMA